MRFVVPMLSVACIFAAACGGRVVVDHGGSGTTGTQSGTGANGMGGSGPFTTGTSTGDVNPVGVGGFGGFSSGDVNPVGVGGFGGTFSSSDVNPVGVGGFGVGGASNVAASVGPGPGSTGTGSTACQSTSCVQNSNGDCSCKGSCPDGSIVRVQCMNEPGGSMCNCFHGGMFVGSCGSVVPQCDVPHSCCAQFL